MTEQGRVTAEKSSTKEYLLSKGFSEEEIVSYFNALGRGPLSIGEFATLAKLPFEKVEETVQKLIEGGLAREIEGIPTRYEAMPPLEILVSQFEEFERGFEELEGEVSDAIESEMENLRGGIAGFKTSVADIFGKTAEDLEKSFMSISMQIITILNDAMNDFRENSKEDLAKQVEILKDQFGDRIEEEFSKFDEHFVEMDKKVGEKLQSHGAQVHTARHSISEIWDELKSAQKTKPEKLWFVSEEEGIKAMLGDMISRGQRTIMLVAPSMSDLPPTLFAHLKPTCRVQVATHVNLSDPDHQNSYDGLKIGDNVQIRDLGSPGDTWGTNVDHSEILIAAVPEIPEGQKVMGIASTADEYVTVFTRFLSDVWLKAKRMQ